MFTVKFKCVPLTGSVVHTLDLDVETLEDTWKGIDIGEVLKSAHIDTHVYVEDTRKELGFTHDVNVWCDLNDDGKRELRVSVYTVSKDFRGIVQVNTADYTPCRVVSVESPDDCELYDNTGEDYFYLVEDM